MGFSCVRYCWSYTSVTCQTCCSLGENVTQGGSDDRGRICEMKTDGYRPARRSAISLARYLAVQTAVQWLRGLVASLSSRGDLTPCQCGICGGQSGNGTHVFFR